MTEPSRHVLVLASTFPTDDDDPVPAFVRDQIVALRTVMPQTRFSVLAPHDRRSATTDRTEHADYIEYRFHYVWPRRWERLAGRGIMPALRENPLLILTVPLLFLAERRATRRLVRQLAPTELYAHWFTPQAVVGAAVARSAGIPLVFTTHASDVQIWKRFGGLGRRIVQRTIRDTLRFTAVSSASLAKTRAFFSDAEWEKVAAKAAVIPMGVSAVAPSDDAAARHRLRAEHDVTDDRVVLFMGRLAEKKGVTHLLDAALLVRASVPDVRFLVAGDGPLRDALEQQAVALNLGDTVRFLGYRSGEDKDALFRLADISVLPSIVTADGDAEGLPVALMEALAYGLPCVATHASVAGEVMTDGVEGVLVADGDAEALAAGLIRLLRLPADEFAAASSAARRASARFDWPVVASATAAFLFGTGRTSQ